VYHAFAEVKIICTNSWTQQAHLTTGIDFLLTET